MNEDNYRQWRDNRTRLDWNEAYKSGHWDYLDSLQELPRYALVSGHIHKLLGRGSVLDAGCGEALLADFLNLEKFSYLGFDFSPVALERARRRVRHDQVTEASIEQFQPPSGRKFDAIVFDSVLQGTETPLESLARYRSFLTDRGLVFVSVFKNPNPSANGPRFAQFLEDAFRKGSFTCINQAEGVSLTADAPMAWRIFVLR
jgi:SAM-dependent methyltransferase